MPNELIILLLLYLCMDEIRSGHIKIVYMFMNQEGSMNVLR